MVKNNEGRISEIVSKKVVTIEEYKELREWYLENNKFNWLGSMGVDGKGELYQLITNYNLTNEKVYEFYLEDEYYREMNN